MLEITAPKPSQKSEQRNIISTVERKSDIPVIVNNNDIDLALPVLSGISDIASALAELCWHYQ